MARTAVCGLLASAACLGPLAEEAPAVIDAVPVTAARIEAVAARHGMVVAQEGRAARIGVEVLEQGGNAVDAAGPTGFAPAGAYPPPRKIGRGGYTILRLPRRPAAPRPHHTAGAP